jgi:hypothetical protein
MAKPMATHSGVNPGYVALRYSGFIGVRDTLSAAFLAVTWYYVLTYCTGFIARRILLIADIISNAVTPLSVL